MSAGVPLPKRVFAHGFLFNRGEKMSKSVGNVIDPFALIDVYGLDRLRYFLLREVPFGQDGNYSHDAIVNRTNSELANDLGNLAQRSLSMIAKHCEARVPGRETCRRPTGRSSMRRMSFCRRRARRSTGRNSRVLAAVISLVSEANRYFAGQEPWALRKTDPARMATVLYVTAEVVRRAAILLQPFVPESAGKMLATLGIAETARSFTELTPDVALKPGAPLPPPQPVFPRFNDTVPDDDT